MKTQITDLAPLKDLRRLKRIWVENNQRRAALERTLGKVGIVKVF